jgi:hypothetical protein
MLINKIRNNEIDPDKYIRFMDAASHNNQPDDESSEVALKGIRKQIPFINFNYN